MKLLFFVPPLYERFFVPSRWSTENILGGAGGSLVGRRITKDILTLPSAGGSRTGPTATHPPPTLGQTGRQTNNIRTVRCGQSRRYDAPGNEMDRSGHPSL